VITAIIAVITGLLLVSDAAFGGQVLLENLAYDIALSIRQAQVYGIAVQSLNGNFSYSYGVHFDTSSPANFLIFADSCTANGLYDPPSASCTNGESVQTTQIDKGFRIVKICVPALATLAACTNAAVPNVGSLDALFIRPEPDAYLSIPPQSCTLLGGSSCYPSARIIIKAPRGNFNSIVIYQNGQISVQNR
jgi:hypothetical protein